MLLRLSLLLSVLASSGVWADTRPNIIFLLTDDQRADTLGCMGSPIIETPNIDRLGREGVIFERAFVTTSICMTSRASILSGQYAARHGIWKFSTEFADEALSQTYPGVLKAAGYYTGFVGKWGVGNPPENLFDYNKGFPGQGRYGVEIDGKSRHLTSVMGDQALEFLEQSQASGSPFCLSISFKAPHVQDSYGVMDQAFPYDPKLDALYQDITIPVPRLAASEYFDRLPDFLKNTENRARWAVRFWGPERYQFSVKSYYRLISGVDVVVGRIREKLEAMGLAENTVIVFTSDHGFYLGEYGFAGKWFAHDVSIRVPLIVHDPRQSASNRGIRRDEMVLSIDVAPTLVDLAGVPLGEQFQGRSLVDLTRSPDAQPWREAFFYEHLFDHGNIPQSEAVRTRDWKYIRYVDSDPLYEELYNLNDDPEESRNLASDPEYSDRLMSLRQSWQDWREAVRMGRATE